MFQTTHIWSWLLYWSSYSKLALECHCISELPQIRNKFGFLKGFSIFRRKMVFLSKSVEEFLMWKEVRIVVFLEEGFYTWIRIFFQKYWKFLEKKTFSFSWRAPITKLEGRKYAGARGSCLSNHWKDLVYPDRKRLLLLSGQFWRKAKFLFFACCFSWSEIAKV